MSTKIDTPNQAPVLAPLGERFISRNWEDFTTPSGRDGMWQFTPLARVRVLTEPFQPSTSLVSHIRAPEGVGWSVVPAGHPSLGQTIHPTDRSSALAWHLTTHGGVLDISPGVVVGELTTITFQGEGGTALNHLVIRAGARSEATVLLTYEGSAQLSENLEVIVEDGAQLTLILVHDWAADAVHLSALDSEVGADATFKHVVVSLGGHLIRSVPSVILAGSGSSLEMLGVGVAGLRQHLESRLYVDHAAPNCASNVTYKNVLLADTSRTAWVGDVRIRPEALQTATYEMNRNLLLETGARADSVPNLEIETGDVIEAGHASATGRFDDEQLFYLQSRGIRRRDAQQLVVRGFVADVLRRVGDDLTRDLLLARIDRHLPESVYPSERMADIP